MKVEEPEWLSYQGRWGQYERLVDDIKWGAIKVHTYKEVGNGPTGPKVKPEWLGAFRAQ